MGPFPIRNTSLGPGGGATIVEVEFVVSVVIVALVAVGLMSIVLLVVAACSGTITKKVWILYTWTKAN